MAKLLFKHSETSYGKFRVFIQDTTSAVGAGLTGLTFSTSGLSIHTIADNEASVTSYTAAGSTIETITTIGTFAAPTATKCRFKEIDSTNLPGWYEIQIADARWAVSGARAVQARVAVTGGFCAPVEIQLALFDVNDSTVQLDDLASYIDTEVAAIYNRIGAPINASIAADIAAVNALVTATAIRSALGLAAANLDTQLGDLPTNSELATALAAADDAVLAAIAALNNPTVSDIADAVWDDLIMDHVGLGTMGKQLGTIPTTSAPNVAAIANEILDTQEMETGYSLREAMKAILSVMAGKSSGFPTSPVFRDINDTKNRVSATLDGDNNRTAVTIDVT